MRTYKLVKFVFAESFGEEKDEALAALVRSVSLPMYSQHMVVQVSDKIVEVAQMLGYIPNVEYPQEEGSFEILTTPLVLKSSDDLADVIAAQCKEGWAIGESDISWFSVIGNGCPCECECEGDSEELFGEDPIDLDTDD